ncbi:hypothetical protein K450DRAFT_272927 [Umbelopsis ramanniana AG]|uniref:NodB homology domain-containing protein n=1 Tax=Umbelopsis ramanniana AG TaxID=1314678 RepID=A0AAD5HDM2_UMBRA|nr:uncharacterized protein K450DRAFT_272927 [Umbelopsis ramanniana AG]KAI8578313.1 hypothetical protein K450DRAFT_272927 [Umbelopsis ramanniana AG]
MLVKTYTLAILVAAMMATSQAATNPHADNVMSGEMMNSGSMSPEFASEKDISDMTFISTSGENMKNMANSKVAAHMKPLASEADASEFLDTTTIESLDFATPVASGNNKHKNYAATSARVNKATGAQLHAAMASASLTPEQKNKLKKGIEIIQSVQESATINSDSLPSAVLPPVPLMTACGTQGQIAVTYSEGPSDATARIVKQLNAANAKVTFFVNATWLYSQQYAMVVQNTYNAGHFIGMTYRVKNDDSSTLSEDEIRNDIINDARVIQSLINVAPKYVRLHYTNVEDTKTENILKELGMVLVGYNLDSQDYSKSAKTQDVYKTAFQKQKETYDAKGSFISIQYDIPDTSSLESLSYILNTINDEGYTMVRMDGCLNDPKPYRKDAASNEYVSDKFTFNTTGYKEGQTPMQRGVIIDDNGSETTTTSIKSGASLATLSVGAVAAHLVLFLMGAFI